VKINVILAAFIAHTLCACGDDSGTVSGGSTKLSNADMEVDSYSQLPSCADKREGKTAYVVNQDQGYICQSGEWVEDDAVDVYSSSSAISSSSEKKSDKNSEPIKIVAPGDVIEGTMTDSRDGKIYKTVTIGSQTWMAENLAYEYKVNGNAYRDYGDDEHGPHYIWSVVMDSAAVLSTNGEGCGYSKECMPSKTVRGICPEGWHVPASEEWLVLYKAVGKNPYALQIEGIEKWADATDAFAFSAYPAGGGYSWTNFIDESAYFWTSSECDLDEATLWYMAKDESDIYDAQKRFGASLRCVRDDSEPRVKPSCIARTLSSNNSSGKTANTVKGSMTDSRDGQTYKTVKIGNQTWMAENLNFDYKVDGKSFGVYYVDSLKGYGRYYNLAAAMDSAAVFSTSGKGCGVPVREQCDRDADRKCKSHYVFCEPNYPVRGVCPEGWHLPDTTEWRELFNEVGKSAYALEAVGNKRWPDATDEYGFSALPAGVYGQETLYDKGSAALFNTSTQGIRWLICAPCGLMTDGYVIANGHGADFQSNYSASYHSVRCVKD
jgi:uncharacterized protein (TIGR02145 family)